MEIVTVGALTFRYPNGSKDALDNVSLNVEAGEFLVIFGSSGCGKTTLLRQMKPQLAPRGERGGEILFRGKPLGSLGERESAAKIGFVQQSPEGQIVTDKVWHELAFGLENLGYDSAVIRRRVAETASFFGIEPWFDKDTSSLSGGQKQLLNLAAVMVMQPELLLLDEPTGQLDPIAAADFLAVLKKINTELGTTVVLTEHRLEEAVPLASRVAVMENGEVIAVGKAEEVGEFLKRSQSGMFRALPAAMRIWSAVEFREKCPVSVNEGRGFLERYAAENPPQAVPKKAPRTFGGQALELRGAWFRYEKALPDVVRSAGLTARFGELLCVMGGNGAGKSTLLKLLSGIKKPYRGEVTVSGKVCLLPQDPKLLFSKDTVYAELSESLSDTRLSKEEKRRQIEEAARLCGLCGLEDRHPYDLSGGEQQRAALAKLLLLKPEILLLDEPEKGLDAENKAHLAEILRGLLDGGVCVVAACHDAEFCAEYADRCALFFDGAIAAEGEPREFFSGNCFYTTAAHRVSRGIVEGAVTVADVAAALGGTLPEALRCPKDEPAQTVDFAESSPKSSRKKLPLWRKIVAAALIAAAAVIGLWAGKTLDFREMLGADGVTPLGVRQLCVYGAMIACLFAAAVMLGGSPNSTDVPLPKKRQLSKRTVAAAAAVLVLIPITLYIGVAVLPRKQYYVTASAILIECMLPFFLVFEGRKPKARELVIIAVLCALGIAGRAAFFMLPQFKPVLAVAIIAGAALGGETGFLVGAVTMLVSNIMFSQGPWTPWQMFAAGLCGALSGVVCRSGFMRGRAAMSVFGAVCAIVIYGGIMNPSGALIWGGEALNFKMVMTYWLTGLPMDCVHAAATAIFLWFLGEPMLKKLDRVRFDGG